MYKPHTWVEINFDAMGKNLDIIKNKLNNNNKIMAVVKADAYGFGAVEVARYLTAKGVSALAVSVLSEGIELRRAGISIPIIIFNYIPEDNCDLVLHYDLTPTVYSCSFARALNASASRWGKQVDIHLNIDTGMSRLGVLSSELDTLLGCLKNFKYLNVSGVYSHFAVADFNDTGYTQTQHQQFNKEVEKVKSAGFKNVVTHMANSAALLRGIAVERDFVRVGAAIYGFYPNNKMQNLWMKEKIIPVLTMKTVVAHIKTLPKDVYVSYGCTYKTAKETVVATLPIGYADGYRRILSNKAEVLIGGRRASIIGTVTMDQCMVDVSHIKDVEVGDEVVLCGCQGREVISLAEMAEWTETINYEFPCLINRRVPRYYLKNNKLLVNRGHLDNL
ncbi:alanine racemase [Clostridium sp. 'deep sea']|uniref:alanine racemase n=1 Tax=Clostridium sp. 'deep sea' TaxID=2779445 RepID=UPI0018965272|nr:alanine racemase [Clostridium sp. 'deep sea']QOR34039.1 alanine racemase [Clostridium sp. 'deep sea']